MTFEEFIRDVTVERLRKAAEVGSDDFAWIHGVGVKSGRLGGADIDFEVTAAARYVLCLDGQSRKEFKELRVKVPEGQIEFAKEQVVRARRIFRELHAEEESQEFIDSELALLRNDLINGVKLIV